MKWLECLWSIGSVISFYTSRLRDGGWHEGDFWIKLRANHLLRRLAWQLDHNSSIRSVMLWKQINKWKDARLGENVCCSKNGKCMNRADVSVGKITAEASQRVFLLDLPGWTKTGRCSRQRSCCTGWVKLAENQPNVPHSESFWTLLRWQYWWKERHVSALCWFFLGGAVGKHDPWLGARADGHQVQISHLRRPQVSVCVWRAHLHTGHVHFQIIQWKISLQLINVAGFLIRDSFSYFMFCTHAAVLLQWTSAAPLAGGAVLQRSCRGEVVPPVVVPAQPRMGADQVRAQVGNPLALFDWNAEAAQNKKGTTMMNLSDRRCTDGFSSSRPSRVLSKFAFSLSQDCELPDKKEVSTDRLQSASSALRPECWNRSRHQYWGHSNPWWLYAISEISLTEGRSYGCGNSAPPL